MPSEAIADTTPVSEAPGGDVSASEEFYPPNYMPEDGVAEKLLGRGEDEGETAVEKPAKPARKAKVRPVAEPQPPEGADDDAGEPEPRQTQAPQPQRKYSEDHYRAAKHFGGMDPEVVDALGWEKVAPFLQTRRQMAEQAQQIEQFRRQQQQPGQQQAPPTQPQPAQPRQPTAAEIAAWQWEQKEDEYPVDPRIVKYSEHVAGEMKKIQEAFETRLKSFAEHLTPFQRHIEAQAHAAREAAGREFHAALDAIDDTEILGAPGAANWQVRQQLWDFAHVLLQKGHGVNLKDATQRAFAALFPDRVGVKPLKKVAAAVKERRGQVVAEPSRRDAEAPLGPDRAARALRRRIQELQGE
jgi:hypothetical protein